MTFFDSIILGIVEGITEFLPVSSTGHLILTHSILNIANTDFLKSFEIAIQLGAIFSVVIFYWRRVSKNYVYFKKIIFACIPTLILGAIAYKFIKEYLMDNSLVVIVSLFIGGIIIIFIENWYKNKIDSKNIKNTEISFKDAFFVGIFQSVAFIPGVSRSAATILGGLLLKYERKIIAEFSFLIAVPTMCSAVAYDLIKSENVLSSGNIPLLLVGFIVSAIVAYIVIREFIKFIQNHSFKGFGWYRIVISIIFFIILYT